MCGFETMYCYLEVLPLAVYSGDMICSI